MVGPSAGTGGYRGGGRLESRPRGPQRPPAGSTPHPVVTVPSPTSVHDEMAERADRAGLRRIHVFAFRDLDDLDAGGSEEHASQVCRHLVAAGRWVVLHTGRVRGAPREVQRDGTRVVRRGGRLGVFATSVLDERLGRLGPADGLIEIFHGVPFFAPLWSRLPQVGVVHHVHLGTWDMLLPSPVHWVGHAVERHLVPRVYRRRTLLTAAPSARDEIVHHYGVDPDHITIAPHGIDDRFSPGGERAGQPLVVAVARLMPQKGISDLLHAFVATRAQVPDLQAVIVGDGPHRARFEAEGLALGGDGWLRFAGRASDEELVDWYRRAWVVCSASHREGFGLTLTEAAACGTPVVATRISGHVDALGDGRGGFLADDVAELADGMTRLLLDDGLRTTMGAAGRDHANAFRWDASAAALLGALCDDAARRR
jgi:glycosyltransferase involved in cell wall biosynthesis